MEALIFFLWVLIVFATPFALITVTYIFFTAGSKGFEILLRLVVSLAIHGLVTYLLLWPMFIVIFAGAHTEPVGEALSIWGRVVFFGFDIIHVIIGWLLCSFIALKFIGIPRRSKLK